jgi:hypothetical protein
MHIYGDPRQRNPEERRQEKGKERKRREGVE